MFITLKRETFPINWNYRAHFSMITLTQRNADEKRKHTNTINHTFTHTRVLIINFVNIFIDCLLVRLDFPSVLQHIRIKAGLKKTIDIGGHHNQDNREPKE